MSSQAVAACRGAGLGSGCWRVNSVRRRTLAPQCPPEAAADGQPPPGAGTAPRSVRRNVFSPGLNFLCAAAPSRLRCNARRTDELLSPPRPALRLAGRARRCPCTRVVITAVQRLLVCSSAGPAGPWLRAALQLAGSRCLLEQAPRKNGDGKAIGFEGLVGIQTLIPPGGVTSRKWLGRVRTRGAGNPFQLGSDGEIPSQHLFLRNRREATQNIYCSLDSSPAFRVKLGGRTVTHDAYLEE